MQNIVYMNLSQRHRFLCGLGRQKRTPKDALIWVGVMIIALPSLYLQKDASLEVGLSLRWYSYLPFLNINLNNCAYVF